MTEHQPTSTFGSLGPLPSGERAALSPLDGRYRAIAAPLADWLSEEALNRARLFVEVRWIEFLLEQRVIPGLPELNDDARDHLRSLPAQFTDNQRRRLADLEAETRHDVKAVEYLVREHISERPDLAPLAELVHFLCTSEDINNLAYALSIQAALRRVWLPAATGLRDTLAKMAHRAAFQPMLARTHGQSATPTTMGKELAVFVSRLTRQLDRIKSTRFQGKLNGATGTYSAHAAVLPDADWRTLSRQFVESLGLVWNPLTTQIEPHDWQVDLYQDVVHLNRIAHNLATDCWTYISLGYFEQKTEGTTGSSTMPHKVNPIRFENAEANLEMSNAVLEVLASSLSTTRLQRDLSDSSLQRNIGVGFGYSLVAIDNLRSGLSRLTVADKRMADELDAHPEVLSEAVQQALRLASLLSSTASNGNQNEGGPEPYALLKNLTRGRTVTIEDIRAVVRSADMPATLKDRLLQMSPADYTGLAPELARGVEIA